MPVATDEESGQAAIEQVTHDLDQEDSIDGATENDKAFLKNVLENTVLNSLVQAHDRLEEQASQPVNTDVETLVSGVQQLLAPLYDEDDAAAELVDIMSDDYVKALINVHDTIGRKKYDEHEEEEFDQWAAPLPPFYPGATSDAIRMVGIRKHADEPLGFTVTINDKHELVVARIFTNGDVFKQGLLHEGDIIREINGNEISTPEQLQDAMRRATGSVKLKVIPSNTNAKHSVQMFMKTHFSYDPYRDNLIPCREAGLAFRDGDVLEILNTDDANWWQARKVGDTSRAGLIPSQALEERRKAFVKPDFDYTTKNYLCGLGFKIKKKKQMYKIDQANEFDKSDIMVYEEVIKMPPFERKTLVLIGAQGVGRRTIKNKFIRRDPERFGTTIPYTSRYMRDGEENGKGYFFVPRETMEAEIRENKFLEHGEFDGNLYGTKVDSAKQVIRDGKMCILDVNPQTLKLLKTPDYMPYIVFIAAPNIETLKIMYQQACETDKTTKMLSNHDFQASVNESTRIEKAYRHLFDYAVVNDNVEETYLEIIQAIEKLSSAHQWVPASWVF